MAKKRNKMKKKVIKLPRDIEEEEKHREWGRFLFSHRSVDSRYHHFEPYWVIDEGSVWSFYNERK